MKPSGGTPVTQIKNTDAAILYHGMTLVTGTGPCYERGALLVKSGIIAAIGPADTLLENYPNACLADATGYLVIPGLINAHTHAPMGFFRGLGHGLDAMIETFLFPAEKSLTPELIAPLSYSYIYAGLRSGVTCFADHYYFVGGVAQALEDFGLRGVVGETIADLGGAFPGRAAWSAWQAQIDSWPYSTRLTPAIAPHAADTVSAPLLKELAAFAKTRRLPLHMHLSQTQGERQRVMQREGLSPVAYAEQCGALGENTLAVHLVSADDDDVRRLAASGTTAGFCPASEIIYEALPPVRRFLEAGIPLALATDSAASNDDADMLSEMRVTGLLLRDRGLAIKPAEILAMATLRGAAVFGLGQTVGRLAPGLAADFVFLRPDLGSLPMQEPLTNLIYSMNSRHVQHVVVDGRFVLQSGQACLLREDDMREAYLAAVAQIKMRLQTSALQTND